ncbi:hypothetical protein [Pasteurella sp. 19428wF3_WM03]
MVKSRDVFVRRKLAESSNLLCDVIEQLRKDQNFSVRKSLEENTLK